ncbi:MAG: uroporphyrinogen decarboxylase family protein, partial [Thermomonas sp.]
VEGEGPKFERPIRSVSDIERLAVPDMGRELRYVMDAVSTIRRELDPTVPLIGFSGSPWTLACYMIEGGGSKDWGKVKALALNEPKAMHQLLTVVTEAVIAYLSAQQAAGAQVLQVFDTWGGTLSPSMYREFSLPYLTRIARELPRDAAPLILFGKGNAPYLEDLADSGTQGLGVDWTVTLEDAARRTAGRVAVQGNLDPAILYASPDAIASQVQASLDSYATGNGGSREGHVFNLGHGLSPDMRPEQVAALVAAVHAGSRQRQIS